MESNSKELNIIIVLHYFISTVVMLVGMFFIGMSFVYMDYDRDWEVATAFIIGAGGLLFIASTTFLSAMKLNQREGLIFIFCNSIIIVLIFPLGTIIGLYTFITLMKKETRQQFS